MKAAGPEIQLRAGNGKGRRNQLGTGLSSQVRPAASRVTIVSEPSLALQTHFAGLPDPRVRGRSRHLQTDIIAIAICAALGGATDWSAVEIFGQTYHDWFRRFLRLPNGIPSHDTFERVFERLDPRAFQRCFWSWTRSLAETLSL